MYSLNMKILIQNYFSLEILSMLQINSINVKIFFLSKRFSICKMYMSKIQWKEISRFLPYHWRGKANGYRHKQSPKKKGTPDHPFVVPSSSCNIHARTLCFLDFSIKSFRTGSFVKRPEKESVTAWNIPKIGIPKIRDPSSGRFFVRTKKLFVRRRRNGIVR